MRLSGHEINSQLRQKLEMPTGCHLYVVLGTYPRPRRGNKACPIRPVVPRRITPDRVPGGRTLGPVTLWPASPPRALAGNA